VAPETVEENTSVPLEAAIASRAWRPRLHDDVTYSLMIDER
jgi:hypothetical protein